MFRYVNIMSPTLQTPKGGPPLVLVVSEKSKAWATRLSYGGNVDASLGIYGITGTASAGGGIFSDNRTGTSAGGFLSGGGAMYLGTLKAGLPAQQGQPFSFGVYGGVGPSLWLSNARSVQQLGGPFTTLSLNMGYGIAKGSLQLAYSDGIWQLSVGLPIPRTGAATPSASASKLTTTTGTTKSGCY